jgi:hypothetical protein
MTKKNTAMTPSLIQCRSEWRSSRSPNETCTGVLQNARKLSDSGEFARTRAAVVATRSTIPLAAST